MTRHLAKVIQEFPSAVIQFVVSDVSKEILPRIPYGRCRYVSFDLSKPPKSQGFDMGSFDIITGFNVLHVVSDIASSLVMLNDLLIPGGCLLIGDLNGDSWTSHAPGSIWFDYIFGSFAEWFAFTDDRSHCTISPQDWRRRLHAAGFNHIYTSEFSADPLLLTLEAQKSAQLSLDVPSPQQHKKLIVLYQQGNEGQLREKISTLDTSSTLSIWLFSRSGFHGDAGMGFFRSLGKEYPVWDIHFVIFDSLWNEGKQSEFVHRLSSMSGLDPLLLVDEQGRISVPRVVPSAASSGQHPFQPSLPWTLSEAGLIQTSLTAHGADFVTVEVVAMSRREGKLRTFVGRVRSTVKAVHFVTNDLVLGLIASEEVSNLVTVDHASLALLPDIAETIAAKIAGAALGILIGCLGCGVSRLRSSRRRHGGKALLLHGSEVTVPSLKWFLRRLDFDVIEAKSNSTIYLTEQARDVNLILSGSDDDKEKDVFLRVLARKCRTFMWNDSRVGLESILNDDPVSIGEALDYVVEHAAGQWPPNDIGLRLSDISLPDAGLNVTCSTSLFDPNKAYLLFGGLGGLGIRVALWMYEVRRVTF